MWNLVQIGVGFLLISGEFGVFCVEFNEMLYKVLNMKVRTDDRHFEL